ncbi:S1C family serine protease [Deinococcus peraridilitoris]|nr:trypsin-like peptidase domain-containing protein [Deinococcus peraridilitoris]
MKRAAGILLLLVGLGLGATLLRDAVPVSDAQNQSGSPAQPQANSAAAQQPLRPLSEANSRLQDEQNTIQITQRFEPGVVYISTATESVVNDPLAQLFGGSPSQNRVQEGLGSGFFVNEQGDILTNFHVVGEATRIQVRLFNNERVFNATVIGKAPAYDLALIRAQNIPRNLIRPIPLGDSDKLQVGQKAIAMGAPFGFDFSVTTGIVSATNRSIPIGFAGLNQQGLNQNTIQTDAAINPGNSGGPLLDSTGRVIGINTVIISPSGAATGTGQNAGIGFSIPINTAKALLSRLQNAGGGIVQPPRIGVSAPGFRLSQLSAEFRQRHNLPANGVPIQSVEPNSPAATAGLRGGNQTVNIPTPQGAIPLRVGGDVVTRIDDKPVNAIEDIQAALLNKRPGDTVRMTVRRGNNSQQLTVRLTDASFQTTRQ